MLHVNLCGELERCRKETSHPNLNLLIKSGTTIPSLYQNFNIYWIPGQTLLKSWLKESLEYHEQIGVSWQTF